jgi:signal-transduction protein with cAMP-binding, CBS, and nucleotidyltransferase domain
MAEWLTAGFGETLENLPLDPPTVVSQADTLAEVALLLAERHVSSALLKESPLRIVTERDLARAWASRCSADDEVATIATSHPYWVPASMTPAEAGAMMISLGIRHLVVLDVADFPLGIISMAQLFTVLVQDEESRALHANVAAVLIRVGQHGASEETLCKSD